MEQALKMGGNIWKGLPDLFSSLPVLMIQCYVHPGF